METGELIHQPVYVYFDGVGGQTFFTAANITEAIDFIIKEGKGKVANEHGSIMGTTFTTTATRSYWLKDYKYITIKLY